MHTASQIKKLLMKTVIFSVDTTNAKKTPFIMRPQATIRNSKRKLAPYDVLDANLKMTKFPILFEDIAQQKCVNFTGETLAERKLVKLRLK